MTVENEDLLAKKNKCYSCKQTQIIYVISPRLLENILKKHLCKDKQVRRSEKFAMQQ